MRSVCSRACGGLLVDRLGLADELLELGPDDVDVDGHARVLEGEQADAHGALDEVGAVVAGPLGQERGQRRVGDDQALDDDPIAFDADTRRGRRVVTARDDGERWRERGWFHAGTIGARP